jgi:hypothetical protein
MTQSDQTVLLLLSCAIQILEGFAYGLFCAAGIALCRTGNKSANIFGYLFLAVTTIIFWLFPWWSKAYLIYNAIVFWNRAPLNFTLLLGLLIVSFVVGLWSGRKTYRAAYKRAIEVVAEPAQAAY